METTPTPSEAVKQAKTHKEKPQFWREMCFAESSIKLPKHVGDMLRDASGKPRTHTQSIRGIVGELNREAGFFPHVDGPHPPIPIWGLEPEKLYDFAEDLYKMAESKTVKRLRFGETESTKQKKSTPTLLGCVASFPTLGMPEKDERERWEKLVVAACLERFGSKMVAVVGHTDEAHYHLHIIAHNNGASAKELQFGHKMVEEWTQRSDMDEVKTHGQAYKLGAKMSQDWYYERVSKPMGWARMSSAPKPRVSRSKALELREHAINDAEAAAAEDRAKLQKEIAEVRRLKSEMETRQNELEMKLSALEEMESESAAAKAIDEAWKEEEKRHAAEVEAMNVEKVKRVGFLARFSGR